jgi:hypothetical protein
MNVNFEWMTRDTKAPMPHKEAARELHGYDNEQIAGRGL